MAYDSYICLGMEKQVQKEKKDQRCEASSCCRRKRTLRPYQCSNMLRNCFMHSSSGFATKSNDIRKPLLLETVQETQGWYSSFTLPRRQFWPRRISGKGCLSGSSPEAANLLPRQMQPHQFVEKKQFFCPQLGNLRFHSAPAQSSHTVAANYTKWPTWLNCVRNTKSFNVASDSTCVINHKFFLF